jgi:hypothetical protein
MGHITIPKQAVAKPKGLRSLDLGGRHYPQAVEKTFQYVDKKGVKALNLKGSNKHLLKTLWMTTAPRSKRRWTGCWKR